LMREYAVVVHWDYLHYTDLQTLSRYCFIALIYCLFSLHSNYIA
jgi:hypothetical protein